MDECVRSDVVRGRISSVDDCRARSAGVATFKWFIGHLVEAHFVLSCSYKYKDERRTEVAGGHVLDSEQVLWSDERCSDAEQSMERLLVVHMVLVVHVEGLCAEVRCVGMGGGDGHDRSATNLKREKDEEEEIRGANNITSLGVNETLLLLCRHSNSCCTIV